MKPQVEPVHYLKKEYDAKERFCSYWHQIAEIIDLNSENILEIGIGTGFVSEYLKKRKFKIITLDIDVRLMPNVVGSVLDVPFKDAIFDVVACYEVLEHVPYENFNTALAEIGRVSKKYAIISLPDIERYFYFHVTIPKLGEIKKLITFPRKKALVHKFDGEHYWEIGTKNYMLNRVIQDIKNSGFEIIKNYRVFEIPHHRFLILEKVIK